jgi:hypothetical protein
MGASAFGDVEGVFLVGLIILSKALLEPLDPARIEQKQIQVVGGQVRVSGELKEEGQPEVAGCLAGQV